jgi:hypothetical protein
MPLEEAIQHQTLQAALSGDRTARRAVLKMMEKRQKWRDEHKPKNHQGIEVRIEHDSDNANDALLLLGIAERDRDYDGPNPEEFWCLLPWAVEAALARRGRRKRAREPGEGPEATAPNPK